MVCSRRTLGVYRLFRCRFTSYKCLWWVSSATVGSRGWFHSVWLVHSTWSHHMTFVFMIVCGGASSVACSAVSTVVLSSGGVIFVVVSTW